MTGQVCQACGSLLPICQVCELPLIGDDYGRSHLDPHIPFGRVHETCCRTCNPPPPGDTPT
jgi:hypothetical protein